MNEFDQELIALGIDIRGLTEEQKYLLVQPSYAPENYHQDGEITPRQAQSFWIAKMKRAGIPDNLINKVKKAYR